jgi:hypothetical protein
MCYIIDTNKYSSIYGYSYLIYIGTCTYYMYTDTYIHTYIYTYIYTYSSHNSN